MIYDFNLNPPNIVLVRSSGFLKISEKTYFFRIKKRLTIKTKITKTWISMPWKGSDANEKEIPRKLKISGKMPVTQIGQTPTINPPIAPKPVNAFASLQAFLSLYFIKATTEVKETKKPIDTVNINEIDNLNQFTVDAYTTISGIVL